MVKKNLNKNLHSAKTAKQDEYYTQLPDIEREMIHYREHFRNKIVFCNCDDPRVSNFFKYFSNNFEKLGLRKLITTCYKNQNVDFFSEHKSDHAVSLEYNGDKNGNKVPDPEEIGLNPLNGDGDFRSSESIELLKNSDIVVTNPPFSLFREYVAQLIKYKKKFIIIGSLNSITYKEIFKLIKANKLWLGYGFNGGNAYFKTPYSKDFAEGVYNEETGLVKFRNVAWFTNLDIKKRHEDLPLYKKYSFDEYPAYNNYDAINVDKTKEIPYDYKGVMGVPISFLDKFNPKQFDILGITAGRDEFEARPIKRYVNPLQINKNGSITNGSKANTRATLLWKKKPNDIYYTADNVKGYLTILYARILIRNKKVIN